MDSYPMMMIFDIALQFNNDDCEEMLSCVFSEIKGLLLTRYEARMITSYTQKFKFRTPCMESML